MEPYSDPESAYQADYRRNLEQYSDAPVKKGSRRGFIAGITVIVFAVVGLVFTVMRAAEFIRTKKEDRLASVCDEYTHFMLPLAAVDPDGFDDISAAPMEDLIHIAVWSVIGSDLDPSAFEYSDDELLVPAADVEKAFYDYFGNQRQIGHLTVEGYGYEFKYDPEKNAYCIPLTTVTPSYTPKVTAVDTKGGATVITCGLINANVWMQDFETGDIAAPEPDKFIKVTLREFSGVRYISALQSTGTPETALPNLNYNDYFTAEPAETTTEEPESETIVITRD